MLLLEAGSDYPDVDSLPEEVKYGYKSTKDIWESEHTGSTRPGAPTRPRSRSPGAR